MEHDETTAESAVPTTPVGRINPAADVPEAESAEPSWTWQRALVGLLVVAVMIVAMVLILSSVFKM